MYKLFFKRFFDFTAAFILLLTLSPIFLIIFTLLFVYYRENPFFFQERPGYKGQLFRLIKFKSMITDYDEEGNLLPDEKRLTRLGVILRRTSLDELPQLLNIIKGDMSFIGPRPLLVKYLPYYTETEFKRHEVRPGITGLSQISGRNYLGWEDRLKLDVKYVENVSFNLDFQIFLKTLHRVIKGSDIKIIPDGQDFDAYKREKNFIPRSFS